MCNFLNYEFTPQVFHSLLLLVLSNLKILKSAPTFVNGENVQNMYTFQLKTVFELFNSTLILKPLTSHEFTPSPPKTIKHMI